MAEFGPEIADQVIEVCNQELDETNQAISRTLETELTLTIGEASSFDASTLDESFKSDGLLVLMKVDAQAALFLVPESSGFLPDWYKEPDATGESKMATLAQELGMLMLPEEFMPLDFKAGHVSVLSESLEAVELAENAHQVAITLNSGDQSSPALLIWPANQPDNAFQADEEEEEAPAAAEEASTPAAVTVDSIAASVSAPGRTSLNGDANALPLYCKSLLKIEVPVHVILATKKMSVDSITDIGIGTIIQFEKSCEDPLVVEVGDQRVAEGEAVKIGEKFGLRVTTIAMPEERYISVKGQRRVR